MNPTDSALTVPGALADEILAGHCVAFVGAGFSAPAGYPAWSRLLEGIAAEASAEVREHVGRLLPVGSAHGYDQAAQALEDDLGRDGLLRRMGALIARSGALPAPMERRKRLLRGIPFRAVLTTNFDPILDGSPPGPGAYVDVLRATPQRWWDDAFWGEDAPGPRVVKLHGDIHGDRDVVLTRRDYRRRLYESPGYMTFLRSVFASHTVLYLGFSFTDAYLNELRSEVLALLGGAARPSVVAYAVAADVPRPTRRHFEEHEGIRFLAYDASGGDHSGFDRWLAALHEATNPVQRLGRLLARRRILWVDPHPDNNDAGFRFLRRVAHESGEDACEIVEVPDAAQAIARLGSDAAAAPGFDLVITHWGAVERTAERLLGALRTHERRPPVVVFGAATDADVRKRAALSRGALAYCYRWETLFQTIERLFLDGDATG
jgi:hypothetical protein